MTKQKRHQFARAGKRRKTDAGAITRVDPKQSPWQIKPVTHFDRVTYVSALSDFAVPFARSFAIAAATGASFGSIAISRPHRVMICTVCDQRAVADDLARIAAARGWLPQKPVAVVNLVFHWGRLEDDGEVARVVKATEPEIIIVEASANGLSEVRSRIGDSDAALVLPVDRPDGDLDSFHLRIDRHGEKYHLIGGEGLILKMKRDAASFVPLGTARVIDIRSHVASKKNANEAESTNEAD